MKKHLLMKTLLVALVCLVGGTSSVWADEVVGTTSSDWNQDFSTTITMNDGGTQHYRFTQDTNAGGDMEGFLLNVMNNEAVRQIFISQNAYDWDFGGTFDYNYASINDAAFRTGMDGATVDMTVYYSSGTLTMKSLVKYSTNYSYYYNYTANIAGSPETIKINLSVYKAQLTITTSEYYDVKATLSHTASLCRNNTSSPVYSLDAEREHYNNKASGGWQGFAYAEFDFSIPAGHSLVSADLIWTTAIAGNNNNWRNNVIDYMSGDVDYDSFGSQTNETVNNFNTTETNVATVSLYSGPYSKTNAQAQTATTDVTSAIRAKINESKSKIIFRFTDNPASADLWGKASKYAPVLVLKTTNEVLYSATFTETNSLNPTVTVYTDAERTSPIEKNALSANTTYYYRAVLAGYENYESSFDVETSDPVVNFTMTALPRYTFTVNAVNSVGSAVIEAIYTDDDSYDGKTHTVYFPKYLTGTGNIVTFSKDDATYYQQYTSASGDATKSASYTAYDGVAYFFEGESYASLGTKETNANYSNGRAGRGLNNGTMNVATIPAAGNYDITYAICSSNVGTGKETQFSFYRNNSGDVVIDVTNLNHSVTNVKTTGTQTVNNIPFAAGDILQFYSKETKIILDYVLVKLATVPATIGTTGYTTFASSYALDLSSMTASEGVVTAYYASSVGGSSVVMTSTDATVEAGTGLLLKGTAGATITIPVAATGSELSGNLLKGCTAETVVEIDANKYVLVNNGVTAEFQNLSEQGATIPAGKAYLDANGITARSLTISFDDEDVTGISAIEKMRNEGNETFFDLQGRKVAQPAKGLYIVNGRKVVVK